MCAFAGNYLRPAKFNASHAHAIAREDSHLAALLNGYTRFILKLGVTSRQVVWLFDEQVWFNFVPVLHRLQGRLTVQC